MSEQGSNSRKCFCVHFHCVAQHVLQNEAERIPLASHIADLRAFAAKISPTVEMTVKKFSKARLFSVHALLARACGMI